MNVSAIKDLHYMYMWCFENLLKIAWAFNQDQFERSFKYHNIC